MKQSISTLSKLIVNYLIYNKWNINYISYQNFKNLNGSIHHEFCKI